MGRFLLHLFLECEFTAAAFYLVERLSTGTFQLVELKKGFVLFHFMDNLGKNA